MAQRDLKKVRSAARAVEKARANLRDAIYAASKTGESIRDIAPWAGLKPTRIKELLDEAKKLEAEGPAGPTLTGGPTDTG